MANSGTYSKDNGKAITDCLAFAKANVRANTAEGARFGGRYYMPTWMFRVARIADYALATLVIYGIYKFILWLM